MKLFKTNLIIKKNLLLKLLPIITIILVFACKKDEPIYEDFYHQIDPNFIQDDDSINVLSIESITSINSSKNLKIKEVLDKGETNRVDFNLKTGIKNITKLKFVVKKYSNIKIFDNDSETLIAVGYVNNYKKNRAYIIITSTGDLYAYFILDDIFYIIKQSAAGEYLIINRNNQEDRRRHASNYKSTRQIKNREPIFITPEFFNSSKNFNTSQRFNLKSSALAKNKLENYLNIVINVSGQYNIYYPGTLYDSIYAMCHSFYSAFLTKEDAGLNLDIKIYIYRNSIDSTIWDNDSAIYLESWKKNALNVFPQFRDELKNTIFVNMHLDKSWDGQETIGRAYVNQVGLGSFAIVGYANFFYSGAMQTLAHEVGHSLGALHADNIYKRYNSNIYDVMQSITGILNNARYREEHLDQANIRRILSNWK